MKKVTTMKEVLIMTTAQWTPTISIRRQTNKKLQGSVELEEKAVSEANERGGDNLEADDTVGEPQSVPHVTIAAPLSGIRLMSDKFKTKIKLLLSILRKHKTPLCVYKEIYEWAFKAQLLPHFDCARDIQYRSEETKRCVGDSLLSSILL